MKTLIALLTITAAAALGQTNAVFSDGTKFYSAGGTTNLVAFSRAVEYAVLTWSSSDLANSAVNLFGTDYETLSSGATINTGTTQAVTMYNAHLVLDVKTITTTGMVTVAGQRVNETTGVITNWTETIDVTATNFYQTSAKFIGSVTNSTTNADLTADIIETSYYDFQNQDFTVSNIRVSFRPSNPVWDIGVELYIIDNDGLTNSLVNGNLQFASTDTIKRAANGVLGHAKANIDSRVILGTEDEGIVAKVTGAGDANPANITEFDLTIGCELK